MINKIKFYFKIWKKYTINSFSIYLDSRFGAVVFLVGKLIRFFFFLGFLLVLLDNTKSLGSYNIYQIAFFYLTFNLIDNLSQLLYREVYRFRPLVVEGKLDFILLQPVNSLFRSLFGGADLLDLIMLLPIIITLLFVSTKLPNIFFANIIIYLLLLVNSMLITTSFHIVVLAIGILTTTVDHSIMIYRDITSVGRLPLDIYKEPIRGLLTFVIPVGIIMTFPAKAMMGFLSYQMVLLSFIVGIVFLYFSIKLWKYALTNYSSASS